MNEIPFTKEHIEDLHKQSKEKLEEIGIISGTGLKDIVISYEGGYYNYQTGGVYGHDVSNIAHEEMHKFYVERILSEPELEKLNFTRDTIKEKTIIETKRRHIEALKIIEENLPKRFLEVKITDYLKCLFKKPKLEDERKRTIIQYASDRPDITVANLLEEKFYINYCNIEKCKDHLFKDSTIKKPFDIHECAYTVSKSGIRTIPSDRKIILDKHHYKDVFMEDELYLIQQLERSGIPNKENTKIISEPSNKLIEVVDKLKAEIEKQNCKTVAGVVSEAPAYLVGCWIEGKKLDDKDFEQNLAGRIYTSLGWGKDKDQAEILSGTIMNLYNSQRNRGESIKDSVSYAVAPKNFLPAISRCRV